MTVGDKIKKIRTFRGMTQKELGLAVGFEEKGADTVIRLVSHNTRRITVSPSGSCWTRLRRRCG